MKKIVSFFMVAALITMLCGCFGGSSDVVEGKDKESSIDFVETFFKFMTAERGSEWKMNVSREKIIEVEKRLEAEAAANPEMALTDEEFDALCAKYIMEALLDDEHAYLASKLSVMNVEISKEEVRGALNSGAYLDGVMSFEDGTPSVNFELMMKLTYSSTEKYPQVWSITVKE